MLDRPFGRGWQTALAATSDERLAVLAGEADRAAFEKLWERHHRGLLAFCRGMLGRREDAEDAVQQTFLSAYHALGRGATPRRFRAWLYAAARNQCLALRQARAGETLADVDVEETEALPALAERRQDIRQMLRDMQQLPEDQRAALTLSTLRPLKHDEIARVIGCSRDEVKSLVFQARASLAASRSGRETPCADIREQLARSPRGAVRRTTVRRHLHDCAACDAFRGKLRNQRQIGALILMLPASAGLKDRAMELIFGATAAGGIATAGIGAAALGHKAGALVTATAVLGAAAGVAVHFAPRLGERSPEVGFARTATSGTPRPGATAPSLLPGGVGSGIAGSHAAVRAAAAAAEHWRERSRTGSAARKHHAAGHAGGAATGPTGAPTTPQPPGIATPQTPASLPGPPKPPEHATQVRPPVSVPTSPPAHVPPAPATPPHVGVPVPPQPPVPRLPRVVAS